MPTKSDSGSGSVTPRGRSEIRETQETGGNKSRSSSRDVVKATAKEVDAQAEAQRKKIKEEDKRREDIANTVRSISDLAENNIDVMQSRIVDLTAGLEETMPNFYRAGAEDMIKNDNQLFSQVQDLRNPEQARQIKQNVETAIDDVLHQVNQVATSQSDIPHSDIDDVKKALIKLREGDLYLYKKLYARLKEKDASFEPTKRLIESIDIDERIAGLMAMGDNAFAMLKKRPQNDAQKVLKDVLLSDIDIFIDKVNKAAAPQSGLPRSESNDAIQKLIDVKKTKPLLYERFCASLEEKDASFEPTKRLIDRINSAQQFADRLMKEHDIIYQKKIKKADDLNGEILKKIVSLRVKLGKDAYDSSPVSRYARAYTAERSAFNKRPSPIEDTTLLKRIGLRIDAINELEIKSFKPDRKESMREEWKSGIKDLISKSFEERIDGLIPNHLRFQSGVYDYVTSLQDKTVEELMQENILEKPQQEKPVEELTQEKPAEKEKVRESAERLTDSVSDTSKEPVEKEQARETAKKLRESLNIKHQERIKPVDDLNSKITGKFALLNKKSGIDANTVSAVSRLLASYQEKDSAFKKNPPPFRDKKLPEEIEMRLKVIGDTLNQNFNEQQKKRMIKQCNSSIEQSINKASKDFEKKMDTLIPKHLAFLRKLDRQLASLQEKVLLEERKQGEEELTQAMGQSAKSFETLAEGIQNRLGLSDGARTLIESDDRPSPPTISLDKALEEVTQAVKSFERVRGTIQNQFGFRDPLAPPKVLPERGGELTALLRNMHQEIIANPGRLNDISYRNGIKSRFIGIKNNSEDEFRYLETEIGHQVGMHHDTWNPIKIIMDEVGGQTRS